MVLRLFLSFVPVWRKYYIMLLLNLSFQLMVSDDTLITWHQPPWEYYNMEIDSCFKSGFEFLKDFWRTDHWIFLLAYHCYTPPRLTPHITGYHFSGMLELPEFSEPTKNLPLSLIWLLYKSVKFKWTCPELMAMQMILVYGHANGLCPIERQLSSMWKVWDLFLSSFWYS